MLVTEEEAWALRHVKGNADQADKRQDEGNIIVHETIFGYEPELDRDVRHSHAKNHKDVQTRVWLQFLRHKLDGIDVSDIVSASLRDTSEEEQEVEHGEALDEVESGDDYDI